MRNKLFLFGSIVVLLLIIVTVFGVMYWSARVNTPTTDDTNPFADTSAERPFASSTSEDVFTSIDTGWIQSSTGNTPVADAPILRMISKEPVSSAVPYLFGVSTTTGTTTGTTYVRYVLRASGNVLETPLVVITPPATISEKTILRVGRSMWTHSGASVLLQYLDESSESIFSYMGSFTATSTGPTSQIFTGRPLPNDIISATFSPDGASVFYLTPSEKGAEGYLESVTSGTRVRVWSTPFRGITAVWGSASAIVLYNNPSQDASGVVWVLDPKTWKARVVLSDQYALSARISPSGTKLLYSMMEGDSESTIFSLRVLDLTTNNITYLPLPTLSEKCVWARTDAEGVYCAVPKNLHTDDFIAKWYMGQLTYEDVLWHFNTDTGAGERILDPSEEVDARFDMIDLSIDPTNTFVTFRTKQQEILWAVRLPR